MAENNIVKTDGRRRFTRYAPFLIWIGVILILGSGQGSMSETSRFIGPLLRFLFPEAAPETLAVYHGYIRKFAHFAEYAVLAFWAELAFRGSASLAVRNWRYVLALFSVAAVAALDEFLQSFNVTRTASPYDVALDIFGGLTAVMVIWMIQNRPGRETV